jgi:uncharacterized cofD-like protein
MRVAITDRLARAPIDRITAAPSLADLRVVALGGGTGLPVVLRGLKQVLFPPQHPWAPERDGDRITAIAAVTDDGGSSGRLRAAYGMLPPGDIRNCLLALANGDPTLTAMFEFRFPGDGELGGHSLGNLILTALTHVEADFSAAVERLARLLDVRGSVLPATVDDVVLHAELSDGTAIDGESRLSTARRPIRRLTLRPAATSVPAAVRAIERAHVIVIGPGSLYSSVIAILLVDGVADAIARSRARVVYVMNLMTEPGESDGHTAVDHLVALRRHAPGVDIHDVIVNDTPVPAPVRDRYAASGAAVVAPDIELLRAMGYRVAERDLMAPGDDIRHDAARLADAILDVAHAPWPAVSGGLR